MGARHSFLNLYLKEMRLSSRTDLPFGAKSVSAEEYSLTSLLPIDTVTSSALDNESILAALNFAALFHTQVLVSDTVLGDYVPLISSFHSTNASGVYLSLTEFIRRGIVKAMYRDKVVVGKRVLHQGDITLTQIADGWYQRDVLEYSGARGITSAKIGDDLRLPYYDEIERCLLANDAIVRYDIDHAKEAFRTEMRSHINSQNSALGMLVRQLPSELRAQHDSIIDQERVTHAELWRFLNPVVQAGRSSSSIANRLLSLYGHLNQQVLANAFDAGQTLERSDFDLLSTFHSELSDRIYRPRTIKVYVEPAKSLGSFLERADIIFDAPAISRLSLLSVDDIEDLRRRNHRYLEMVSTPLRHAEVNLAALQQQFLDEMTKYWQNIADKIDSRSIRKERRFPTTVWLDHQPAELSKAVNVAFEKAPSAVLQYAVPILGGLAAGRAAYAATEHFTNSSIAANDVETLVTGSVSAALSGSETLKRVTQYLGGKIFQHRMDDDNDFRTALPPKAFLGLQRVTPR